MTALDRARAEVARLEYEQARRQATRAHTWTEPRYTPDVRPGYWSEDIYGRMIKGQEPRRVWTPEKITPRWTRSCSTCGRVETTTETTEIVTRTPRFGNTP